MEDQGKTNKTTSLRFDRYLVKHPADRDGCIYPGEMELIELSTALALVNEALEMDGFTLREQQKLIGAGLKFTRRCCYPAEQDRWTSEARVLDFLRRLNLGWKIEDLRLAEESAVYVNQREFLAYKRIVEETLNGREPYPVTIVTTPPTTSEPRGQEAA